MTIDSRNKAISPQDNFLVCYLNQYRGESILQSESTDENAELAVDFLNEHERNNARPEKFYWRQKKDGE